MLRTLLPLLVFASVVPVFAQQPTKPVETDFATIRAATRSLPPELTKGSSTVLVLNWKAGIYKCLILDAKGNLIRSCSLTLLDVDPVGPVDPTGDPIDKALQDEPNPNKYQRVLALAGVYRDAAAFITFDSQARELKSVKDAADYLNSQEAGPAALKGTMMGVKNAMGKHLDAEFSKVGLKGPDLLTVNRREQISTILMNAAAVLESLAKGKK